MDDDKISRVKQAVKNNFDQSPGYYREFEDRHGFFRTLNGKLLSRMDIPAGARVLDVGCGTGASSLMIPEVVSDCSVWGLDNSPSMLDTARSRAGSGERMVFVEGDAAKLEDYFHFPFDAIVYSASIFLIPDFRESLSQAKRLLRPGGKLGISFMDGVYDSDLKNALAVADRDAMEGVSLKKPVKLSELHSFFTSLFPRAQSWQEDFFLSRDAFREFFSVPAMSAGLFPGIPYPQRAEKVARLIDHLPKKPIFFRWILLVGGAE